MNLNDCAMLIIAFANLILRVWEMRKERRRNTGEPDQMET